MKQITGDQFCEWLAEMKANGNCKTDLDAAYMLGKSKDSIVIYKREGADRTIALACRALSLGLTPWGHKKISTT